MKLLHGPPSDPAYGGMCGSCDGGGFGGCRTRTVSAAEGYYHCDPCQADACQGCIEPEQVCNLPQSQSQHPEHAIRFFELKSNEYLQTVNGL